MIMLAAIRNSFISTMEQGIRSSISARGLPSSLIEALEYALFPGGKRIRPLLVLILGQELGVEPGKLIPAAMALELFHTASLIHDDLPPLDNDDFRRGKPSLHKQFGEPTAILLGDIAISLASELALSGSLHFNSRMQIALELSRAFTDVSIGQQLDLLPHDSEEKLLNVYRNKTGALFRAAAACAAIGAGESESFVGVAREFGENLGIEFQLHDDLLDSSSEKGRPAGSDVRNLKDTAVKANATGLLLQRFSVQREDTLCKMEKFCGPLPITRELVTELIESISM